MPQKEKSVMKSRKEFIRAWQSGEIKWQGRAFYVSQVLAGEHIALMPCGDNV